MKFLNVYSSKDIIRTYVSYECYVGCMFDILNRSIVGGFTRSMKSCTTNKTETLLYIYVISTYYVQ